MNKVLSALSLALLISACEQKSETDYLNSAKSAIQNQQLNTANIELKNAIRVAPENAEARFLLGSINIQLGNWNGAAKELERALEYDYPADKVIPLLSVVYQKLGENKNLFKLTAKAKGLKPKQLAQLKLIQLQAYVNSGNHNKAKALIDEIKKIPNANEFGQLALAYDLLINQQFDETSMLLEQTLQTYPLQADALKLLARVYLSTQQTEKALSTYQTYIDNYSEDKETQFLVARLYSDNKQTDKAEPIVDRLLEQMPNQPSVLQLKAAARLNDSDFKSAFDFAEQALAINPEDNSARLIAGVSSYLQDDLQNTLEHLSLLAGILPSDHPALRILADTQLKLGLSLEASSTVARFEQIGDEDTVLLSGVGRALIQGGEIKKAKAILNKQPKALSSAKALANVGLLKLSLNDINGIIDIEQAVEKITDPNLATDQLQLQMILANAYISSKDYNSATKLAKKWQSQEQYELQGLLLEAKVHSEKNEIDEAKALYNQALAISSSNPMIELELLNLLPMETTAQQQAALNKVNSLMQVHTGYVPLIQKHYLLTRLLKQPETMSQHLSQLLLAEPNNIDYKITYGQIKLAEKDFEQSINAFESLKTNEPQRFWRLLGQAYLGNKQHEELVALYKEWIDKQPKNTNAILGMVKVHDALRQFKKALELTQYYINELGGRSLELNLLHLRYLAKAKKFDVIEEKLMFYPEDIRRLPFVKGIEGQVQLSNNDYPQAIKNLTTAYNTHPSPENTALITSAHIRNGNTQTAIQFLKQHIVQHENDEQSVLQYAMLQTGRDNTDAKFHYLKLLDVNDRNFIAQNNLAYIYSQEKNFEAAYKHAQQAHSINPKDGQVLDTLGSIELKLGKFTEAKRHLTEAQGLITKLTDENKVNYLESLLANKDIRLAEKKMAQFSFTDKAQLARLNELKQKYNIK